MQLIMMITGLFLCWATTGAAGLRPLDHLRNRVKAELDELLVLGDAASTGAYLRSCVVLVRAWPERQFRSQLIRLLDSTNSHWTALAIDSLAAFRDQESNDVIRALCGRQRNELRFGDRLILIEKYVANAIDDWANVSTFSERVALIEFSDTGEVVYSAVPSDAFSMTIPDAILQLGHSSLSVRLQAMTWLLIECGVVVDVRPLQEAWPMLSVDQRRRVLEQIRTGSTIWTGSRLLRDAIEVMLDDAEVSFYRNELFECLGRVGSERAARLALDWFASQFSDESYSGLAEGAAVSGDEIEAFGSALRSRSLSEELPRLLRWSRHPNRAVAIQALGALLQHDDWNARYAICGAIAAQDECSVRLLDIISDYGVSCDESKWFIGRCISRTAVGALELGSEKRDLIAVDATRALERMFRRQHGPSGYLMHRHRVDIETAKATALRWADWLSQNEPIAATGTAASRPTSR